MAKKQPMQRLHGIINDAYDTGKMPNCITLSDFRVLESVYAHLAISRKAIFFQDSVKGLLEKLGFYVHAYDLCNYEVEI